MTGNPDASRIADKPAVARRDAEITRDREIADGMARRYVEEAEIRRLQAAHALGQLLKHADLLRKL